MRRPCEGTWFFISSTISCELLFFIDAFPLFCSLQDVLIQPGSGLAAGHSQTGSFSEWQLPGTKVLVSLATVLFISPAEKK